jgi:hypothetical protein
MTTAGTATQTQTRKTVPAQDVQLFSLGQRTDKAGPLAAVPGLANVVAAFCIAGSSPAQDLLLTITGLNLTTNTPAVVLLQPRQSANQDFGFPDEFAVQLIDTSATELLVRIQRLDGNSGWRQDLRLDIFIVDSVVNPQGRTQHRSGHDHGF